MSDERLKMFLDFTFRISLLLGLIALAIVIGVGHVIKESSFGLEIVLGALASLSGTLASKNSS